MTTFTWQKEVHSMEILTDWRTFGSRFGVRKVLQTILLSAFLSAPARAQSPWENAVTVLQAAFTGPIARGLSLVAIVVGGLMFAFGEGESKRLLAGIIFGVGMAIGAVNFMSWLFGA
jgi:type IV secretory pathway VirB2 component (pilin)